MLTIDAKALLAPPRPFTDDELTELIAAVVDDLDARVIDPSVSTVRSDAGVYVEVSMTIDTDNPWVASATAAAAMRDACVLYTDAVPEGHTTETRSLVRGAAVTFERIRRDALPCVQSRDLILEVADDQWKQ
jgi:hypothetical protein